jgi:6-phosphogluconolactonase
VSAPRQVLAAAVAARLVTSLVDAQAARGRASVVLTGGGIGIGALRALAASPARTAVDWRTVDVWWGDERFVPSDDPDRNDGQAMDVLRGALDLDPSRVHPIGASDAYPDPDAAAAAYVADLLDAGGGQVPAFDVLLLGMGPEGHTASIFPGSPAAFDTRVAFAVRDCPKPPPTRVSLGFAAIQTARQVWMVVSGEGKADAVAKVLGGGEEHAVPAAGALGTERSLLMADWGALRR